MPVSPPLRTLVADTVLALQGAMLAMAPQGLQGRARRNARRALDADARRARDRADAESALDLAGTGAPLVRAVGG